MPMLFTLIKSNQTANRSDGVKPPLLAFAFPGTSPLAIAIEIVFHGLRLAQDVGRGRRGAVCPGWNSSPLKR
jgi:hypothetical protein